MEPKTRRILLAIGGGIAAYKAADLCSKLAQAGHQVQVVTSRAATEFIGDATLAALSGRPVVHEVFDANAAKSGKGDSVQDSGADVGAMENPPEETVEA